MTLNLTFAAGVHDRSIAFILDRVTIPGIQIDFHPMDIPTLLRKQAQESMFDVAEFSLSSYCVLRSQYDMRFVAIPVFPSRAFRHSSIIVDTRQVRSVQDLLRVPVGATQFQQTAVVWIRGLLATEYGVDSNDFDWVLGGLNTPLSYSERVPIDLVPGLSSRLLESSDCLNSALVEGRIGAIVGAQMPASLGAVGHVQRLFPNWPAIEKDFYLRQRTFPIMHTIVLRSELLSQEPNVSRLVYEAFLQAQAIGRNILRSDNTLAVSLPWLRDHLTLTDTVFGAVDPFCYGFEANRTTLDTFLTYARAQGLVRCDLSAGDLFVQID